MLNFELDVDHADYLIDLLSMIADDNDDPDLQRIVANLIEQAEAQ